MKIIIFIMIFMFSIPSFADEPPSEEKKFIAELALQIMLLKVNEPNSDLAIWQSFDLARSYTKARKKLYEGTQEAKSGFVDVDVTTGKIVP